MVGITLAAAPEDAFWFFLVNGWQNVLHKHAVFIASKSDKR
jgi:hypothetical protein